MGSKVTLENNETANGLRPYTLRAGDVFVDQDNDIYIVIEDDRHGGEELRVVSLTGVDLWEGPADNVIAELSDNYNLRPLRSGERIIITKAEQEGV